MKFVTVKEYKNEQMFYFLIPYYFFRFVFMRKRKHEFDQDDDDGAFLFYRLELSEDEEC